MAKPGAGLGGEDEGMEKVITEGGLRQEWKKRRAAEERKVRDEKGSKMEPQGPCQLCPLPHR